MSLGEDSAVAGGRNRGRRRKNSPGVMEAIVRTEGLTRKFGELTAVDRLSLEIRRGEIFGLLGPNGAGKTTSVKMTAGLLRPTAGQVFIDGAEVDAASRTTRRKIGLCPQDVAVWGCLTCLENVVLMGDMYELPRATSIARARELLATMNLLDKANVLARNLSGGMKRRLNLAMALVHDSLVVFLDEPTAGLDPQSRLSVFEFIEALGEKREKNRHPHHPRYGGGGQAQRRGGDNRPREASRAGHAGEP